MAKDLKIGNMGKRLKKKYPFCHSERSKKNTHSVILSEAKNLARFFASLRMTRRLCVIPVTNNQEQLFIQKRKNGCNRLEKNSNNGKRLKDWEYGETA